MRIQTNPHDSIRINWNPLEFKRIHATPKEPTRIHTIPCESMLVHTVLCDSLWLLEVCTLSVPKCVCFRFCAACDCVRLLCCISSFLCVEETVFCRRSSLRSSLLPIRFHAFVNLVHAKVCFPCLCEVLFLLFFFCIHRDISFSSVPGVSFSFICLFDGVCFSSALHPEKH